MRGSRDEGERRREGKNVTIKRKYTGEREKEREGAVSSSTLQVIPVPDVQEGREIGDQNHVVNQCTNSRSMLKRFYSRVVVGSSR